MSELLCQTGIFKRVLLGKKHLGEVEMVRNKKIFLSLLIVAAGCSSKYDACIEKQKEEFRASNPNASYALVQKKQSEFEMMCSSLKGK